MKRYSTLQRLIKGEWYQSDDYFFRYDGYQYRKDLDLDQNFFSRMSINHSGCFRTWGDYSPQGFFWKGEISGCKHLPNFQLPIKYQNNEK